MVYWKFPNFKRSLLKKFAIPHKKSQLENIQTSFMAGRGLARRRELKLCFSFRFFILNFFQVIWICGATHSKGFFIQLKWNNKYV